jgi:hypothetical protein
MRDFYCAEKAGQGYRRWNIFAREEVAGYIDPIYHANG